jgi:replicative DNA helicase
VSASSNANAAAAAAAVQHNSVVTVSQEASLDELVQPLTAEEAEVSTYLALTGSITAVI